MSLKLKYVCQFDEKLNILYGSVNDLEIRINSIQIQEAPVRVVCVSITKAPLFEGNGPFNIFKFEFDMVSGKNSWGNEEKAIEVI